MRNPAILALFSLLAPILPVHAQEKTAEPAVYKVEFAIRDGSPAAAQTGRRYSMLVGANEKGFFNVGDKVPYATSSFQPGIGAAGPQPLMQYTYLDTGVNIECRVAELNGKITLNAQLDISAIHQHDKVAAMNPPNPTVAAIRLGVIRALMSLGKPTQIVSMDDPVTMKKFDVEATVTKLN
jgi:hypothetical protein